MKVKAQIENVGGTTLVNDLCCGAKPIEANSKFQTHSLVEVISILLAKIYVLGDKIWSYVSITPGERSNATFKLPGLSVITDDLFFNNWTLAKRSVPSRKVYC